MRSVWFVPMMLAALVAGCAGRDTAVRELPILITLQLDKAAYDIGDPVIVTVRVQNNGKDSLSIPRLDSQSMRFRMTKPGENPIIEREPVESAQVAPEPRQIEPGKFTERKFLFTRLTTEEGRFVVSASLKGLAVGGDFVEDTVFSKAAPYAVAGRVALRRDPASGMILKEQAAELARMQVKGKITKEDVVLLPLEQSGLFKWVAVFQVKGPGGKESEQWFDVSPYTGKVQPVQMKKDGSTP